MKRYKDLGFTLIELLIVIAIISILAAALFPNLVNARSNSQNAAAQVYTRNMLQWATSWLAQDQTRTASGLSTDCTDASYEGEGAPPELPGSVTICEVLIAPNGPDTFGVRVVAQSGEVFEASF